MLIIRSELSMGFLTPSLGFQWGFRQCSMSPSAHTVTMGSVILCPITIIRLYGIYFDVLLGGLKREGCLAWLILLEFGPLNSLCCRFDQYHDSRVIILKTVFLITG